MLDKTEKQKRIISIICCPLCHADMTLKNNQWYCSVCEEHYPQVAQTPILIHKAKAHDYSLIAADDPDYPISRHDYAPRSYELIHQFADGWVLDLGSGGRDKYHDNVIQLDIFNFPNVEVVAVGEFLPFKDNTFDGVICQAVFEHLQYPQVVVMEIERVLKPGGLVKVDTAFLHPLHGYPQHYFNATRYGLLQWFHQFEIVWSGSEPYQMPWIMFDTIMDVYLHEMDVEEKKQLLQARLVDLLQATRDLKQGQGEHNPLSQILLNTRDNTTDMIAAGVSALARKKTSSSETDKANTPKTVYSLRIADQQAIISENKAARLQQELDEARVVAQTLSQQLHIKQQVIDDQARQIAISRGKFFWYLWLGIRFVARKVLHKWRHHT